MPGRRPKPAILDPMLDPHRTTQAARPGSPDPAGVGVPVGSRAGCAARDAEHEAVTAGSGPDRAPDLDRIRAVIEALPEPVLVTDPKGRVQVTNPAADRLFAGDPVRDQSDLLSRFEEHGPDGAPGALATLATALDQASSASVTVRPRHQPNRWFVLRTVDLDQTVKGSLGDADGTPESGEEAGGGDGSRTGAGGHRTVFVLRDVTESRELRPEREAFLAVLSHELRTPITTIYAGSSVLARRPTLPPPATQTLARDISAEAARLYDLVEDLIVLARLERRILDPLDEPVLLQRAVEAIVRMAAERLPEAPISLVGALDAPPVHGDATYVEQACRNLILSSIRFAGPTPDRGLVIALDVDIAAGEVTVRVLDRGPRLSPQELERAFDLPDSTSIGRLAGAGVGAFVCRHLVEAMGGRTWAHNRPDGGVEMGFALRIDERM